MTQDHKRGRVEEILAAGEAGDPHTKSFFFPCFVCCDLHRPSSGSRPKSGKRSPPSGLNMGFSGKMRLLQPKRATSVDTACASVDLLSQNSPDGVLGKPLVSTLPHLVSTHCPSDYEVQEEEQVEDGNASEC
ncbi:hypothetical protein Taro_019782 [Colocasia esculenta]|uniref:Uncharacterized protein n=1 Tax=Colocasia esculenta TaxID=4460 RepID=A0A843V6J8_COLES|nr:hypothetical protein [Colocasia esculenta]